MAVARGVPRAPEVACVGDNCVDVAVERPEEELAGGNALNVAVELARAGRVTSYFGAVGDDARGAIIVDAARAADVDVTAVRQVSGPTGITIVARDGDGERSFVSQDYGVSAGYRLDDDAARRIAAHRWAHFARQPDLAVWAPALRADGLRLSCDLGVETVPGTLEEIAPHLDVAFLSTSSAEGRTGQELLEEALKAGADLAVVTCGRDGSIAGSDARRWRAAAVGVDEVVDTLGAGDAFIAAFISTMLAGLDIDAALRAGSVAGAAACTRRGLASPATTEEISA
jgi:fructoselysine 6-kinase